MQRATTSDILADITCIYIYSCENRRIPDVNAFDYVRGVAPPLHAVHGDDRPTDRPTHQTMRDGLTDHQSNLPANMTSR